MNFKTRKGKVYIALIAALATGTVNVANAENTQKLATTVVKSENESSVSHTIKEVTADDISKKSLSNIEDITRYIPGVQVNDAGNRFGDNGFNIRGLQGDAVAVTVDGISLGETLAPANFSAYGMYDSTRGQVELEHVKTISITKGPSSVANGSNALAGSVAYTTFDAADFLINEGNDTAIKLKLGYDSRSAEKLANFTLANRTGAFESLLQFTLRDSDETEAHSSGKTITEPASATEVADPFSIETQSILAKFSYEFVEGQHFGVLLDQTDRTFDGNPLSRQSPSYFDFATDDENNKTRYGLFYTWDDADNVAFDNLSVTLDQQELFTAGITSFGYRPRAGDPYLRREDRSTQQDSTSLNIDFEKFIEGDISHQIVYGIKWENRDIENVRWDRRYNDLTDTSGYRDGYPIRDAAWVPVTETEVFNVYISDKVQLTEQFSLSAGLRYDSTEYSPTVDDTFEDTSGTSVVDSSFSALAGELVAEFEFIPNNFILASYSQGYKAPSAQQLYLGTDGSDVIVDKNTGVEYTDLDTIANADLEAEESSSIELGYKLETEHASVTITAYKTQYKNMIQNVSLTTPYNPPVTVDEYNYYTREYTEVTMAFDEYSQSQNVGSVDVQGIELDAIYAFTDNFYTRITYATIEGEYKDSLAGDHNKGDSLETAAPDSGTWTIGYQADNDQWGVALHTLWFDKVEKHTQPDPEDASVIPGDLSFTSLNNGHGPAHYPDSYTIFDLTAFYDVTENLQLTAAAYNLTDKEYYRWEVLNSIRPGRGGFFGGVSADGYKRFSEPGRSFSLNLSYTF